MHVPYPTFLLMLMSLALTSVPALGQRQQFHGGDVYIGDDNRLRVEVPSTTNHYYVLYYRPEIDDAAGEIAVAMQIGEEQSTTLTEPLGIAPSSGYYRVSQFQRDEPHDHDNDGRDDIEELTDTTGQLSPLNAADHEQLRFRDGVTRILNRQMFRDLSYQGLEVSRDRHLEGLEFVKFYILDTHTDNPIIYFMNTNTHRAHGSFGRVIGVTRGTFGEMRGEMIYHPYLTGPSGKPGVYRFEFEPRDNFSFEAVQRAYELFARNMPFLQNNFVYYPMPDFALPRYYREKDLYDASRIPILLEEDLFADISFLPLNSTFGFGLLRRVEPTERPGSRDIVLYESLPNEMSRVGGVITTVPQTPLSHVNLRAIQDNIPNAFIKNALDDEHIAPLIGKYVRFEVAPDGYEIREATVEEVNAHYADQRPVDPQLPVRNLSVTEFQSLDIIEFADSDAFGVKSANLATLRTFGFNADAVPNGFALPFFFYDAFMQHNDFYADLEALIEEPAFISDVERREHALENFRDSIKDAPLPPWMTEALSELQNSFAPDTSIRCRSSTNNEDLPGFSGAGLYDSFTHHPDEGHLSKSIKQVYASLWNFRAFEERAFFRIDHAVAAMGVLLHPNFKDELANGVAVTTDPLYQTEGNHYLNTQVGENLVTNPDAQSIPEEILLNESRNGNYTLIRHSNQVDDDQQILSDAHLNQLRPMLNTVNSRFRSLYGLSSRDTFAMEVEFKITSEGTVTFKQARPWVFQP